MRIFFDGESVYGQRRASVDGFVVMANNKGNVYRRSALWKRGTVQGVQMLPRNQHRKPQNRADTNAGFFRPNTSGDLVQKSKLGVGSFFTPVQTLKQATAGASFFSEVLSMTHNPSVLKIPENAGLVCVDLFGYDGFSSEACFNLGLSSLSVRACVTVNHSYEICQHVHNLISRHVHAAARAGTLDIAGFPKFDVLVGALQSHSVPLDVHLSVSSVLPCGALVLNDALVSKWANNDWTKEARNAAHGVRRVAHLELAVKSSNSTKSFEGHARNK